MRVFPFAVFLVLGFTGCVTAQPTDVADPDPAPAAEPPAEPFRVYTAGGETASLDAVIAAMREANVVILGEQHDDSTTHALQRRLFSVADQLDDRPTALALEMFERDVQGVLDEYLAGLIRERDFLAAARPWSNYVTDYRPLVEYARMQGLPVIAANAPQRYVSRVSRLGPDALAELGPAAQALLPPDVAPASDELRAEFFALMQGMMGHGAADAAETDTAEAATTTTEPDAVHGGAPDLENLLAAQNLRDASMGWVIAAFLDANPEARVVHLTGTFHAEGGLGVPEHLARYRPETRVLVVTAKPDDAFPALDADAFRGSEGGFFIVVDPAVQ